MDFLLPQDPVDDEDVFVFREEAAQRNVEVGRSQVGDVDGIDEVGSGVETMCTQESSAGFLVGERYEEVIVVPHHAHDLRPTPLEVDLFAPTELHLLVEALYLESVDLFAE